MSEQNGNTNVTEQVSKKEETMEETNNRLMLEKLNGMSMEQMRATVAELMARVETMAVQKQAKGEEPMELNDEDAFIMGVMNHDTPSFVKRADDDVPKNHKPVTPKPGRFYTILKKSLPEGGVKIPQQQRDIASILLKNFEVGKPFSEVSCFAILEAHYAAYPQLRNSKQTVSYLFTYYRGLARKNNHAGYLAMLFLRQTN